MTSWKSMTGTGFAVIRQSDTVTCPHCAESIKRAATKCRFCGETVTAQKGEDSASAMGQRLTDANTDVSHLPPLEETNNPIGWIIASIVFIFVIMAIAANS